MSVSGFNILQANEDAGDLVKVKGHLEDQKKKIEELVLEKDAALQGKIKTIGNYVHESVPISDNEVRELSGRALAWR